LDQAPEEIPELWSVEGAGLVDIDAVEGEFDLVVEGALGEERDFYIIVYGPLNLIQVFSLYLTNIISPYFNHFTGSQPLTDNNNRNRPQQKLVSLKV